MKDVIAECLESLGDLSRWDERVFEVVCKSAASCCSTLLEALDDELAKKRDKGLRMVGERPKTIVTKFGSFTIKRRLYKDKEGTSKFLLDRALGLKPRIQATSSLEATVVRLASKMPFREAATLLEETSGGTLSHQMIHRILQSAGDAWDRSEKLITENLLKDGELLKSKNKYVAHLFVEADGTMINLQRSTKKKAEVKLLVAHEGWESIGKDKWALKDKTILAGLHSAHDTWERFTTTLLGSYRPEVLSRLVMGGDGASWVRGGSELFSDSLYQLDRFHLRRALLRASGNMRIANNVYVLAADGDLCGALSVLETAAGKEPERALDLKKAAAYLRDNAHGLIDYRTRLKDATDDMRGLGAIESNIDKILANRMKKRGMAWSLKGAHHMAKVIQMLINGAPNEEPITPYAKANTTQLRKALTTVKRTFNQDSGAWLAARMPALLGPHQGRPWVKALRDMAHVTPAGMQS